MADTIQLTVNGASVTVARGAMVSAAVAAAGVSGFRRSVLEEARGPLCGMGICFECRVTIDGRAHVRSCQLPCEPGMEVWTDGGDDAPPAPGLGSRESGIGALGGQLRPATRTGDANPDVVIVGAGPAGLAAARRAAECGANVTLVDDNPRPGGQIWRGDPWRAAVAEKVTVICGARVLAAPETGCLLLESFESEREIRYDRLILATGARERFLPFPGWTLPNVMGAGGLQALAKSGLAIEGKRVVVAGSGPLLLAAASYFRDHGARLQLIAEQADRRGLYRFAAGLARHPRKLAQAIALRARLAGIRYLTSCWPIAADGSVTGARSRSRGREGAVESEHETDARWRTDLESVTLYRRGKTWREPCDYLACGFGLVPNTELAALLGCRLGASGVEVDEFQETSVAGVYAAGEVTGIGGLDLSLAEGEIAGYAAAGKPELARGLFPVRESQRRFAGSLDRAFALREELKNLPQDDTLVCRCEDVSFERICRRSGWRDAKLQTRCGMGPCQGRVCGAALEFLLGWKTESVRPPVFPARIATLSGPKCPRP